MGMIGDRAARLRVRTVDPTTGRMSTAPAPQVIVDSLVSRRSCSRAASPCSTAEGRSTKYLRGEGQFPLGVDVPGPGLGHGGLPCLQIVPVLGRGPRRVRLLHHAGGPVTEPLRQRVVAKVGKRVALAGRGRPSPREPRGAVFEHGHLGRLGGRQRAATLPGRNLQTLDRPDHPARSDRSFTELTLLVQHPDERDDSMCGHVRRGEAEKAAESHDRPQVRAFQRNTGACSAVDHRCGRRKLPPLRRGNRVS